MIELKIDQLPPNERDLLLAAQQAKERAYSPYSHFKVGAAIRTKRGDIITGCNVENASFGLTICAERVAIFKAVSEGFTDYEALAIVARGEDFDTKDVTGPCGGCRQVIHEFAQISGRDLRIFLGTTNLEKIVEIKNSELMSLPFGPLDLGIEVDAYRR